MPYITPDRWIEGISAGRAYDFITQFIGSDLKDGMTPKEAIDDAANVFGGDIVAMTIAFGFLWQGMTLKPA